MERVCAKCFDVYNKNKLSEKEMSKDVKLGNEELTKKSIFEQQSILCGKEGNTTTNDEWQDNINKFHNNNIKVR